MPDLLKMSLGYAVSLILIPTYVNLFSLWKILNSAFGKQFMFFVPIALTASVLAALSIYALRKKNSKQDVNILVISGMLICASALFIPNSAYPVKRVHVVEYMFLVLVVRFSMSYRIQGMQLLLYSFIFAAILGIHDEVLQGFNQARTFGLKDIATNVTSCLGAALLFQGLDLFNRQSKKPEKVINYRAGLYLLWVGIALLAFILPLPHMRGLDHLPLWLCLPLISCLVVYSLYAEDFTDSTSHGIAAISLVALGFTLYPLYGYVAKIPFY